MRADDVVELLDLLAGAGLGVWVDGGWGVDALLGQETRPHADLDIALRHADVPALRTLLAARGYREIPRDDSWACNFVLQDAAGRELDVHSFELDPAGANALGVPYRAEHLTGTGTILTRPVRCIAPEWVVRFHTGYALKEKDYRDVKAICEAFGIEMPEEHRAYWAERDDGV